jgi:uncharacterized membrane protein YtjA (UPF0391 family)
VPRLFLSLERNRYIVYALIVFVVVALPEATHGLVNPLAAATTGTATVLFNHVVDPGVTPIFMGLPNIFMLLG